MGLAYHTELYLFVFLPLVVLVYHFSSQKMRRAVLILADIFFSGPSAGGWCYI